MDHPGPLRRGGRRDGEQAGAQGGLSDPLRHHHQLPPLEEHLGGQQGDDAYHGQGAEFIPGVEGDPGALLVAVGAAAVLLVSGISLWWFIGMGG